MVSFGLCAYLLSISLTNISTHPPQKRDKRVKKFIWAMEGALTSHLDLCAKGIWMRDNDAHQRKIYETKRKNRQKEKKPKDPPSNFVIVCAGCMAEIAPAYKVKVDIIVVVVVVVVQP